MRTGIGFNNSRGCAYSICHRHPSRSIILNPIGPSELHFNRLRNHEIWKGALSSAMHTTNRIYTRNCVENTFKFSLSLQ